MVFFKYWHFFYVLISGKRDQGNVFYDILERKHAFLDYKNKELKKVKTTGIFQKGSVHGFGQNLAIYPCFYSTQNSQGKCVSG